MKAYRLARELAEETWTDAEILSENAVTEKISGQLYSAVGSIGANLAEGYSRSSGRERAHIFEYALGSVRESMMWFQNGQPVLTLEVVRRRLDKLEEIRRILLAVIPRERGRLIRPKKR